MTGDAKRLIQSTTKQDNMNNDDDDDDIIIMFMMSLAMMNFHKQLQEAAAPEREDVVAQLASATMSRM